MGKNYKKIKGKLIYKIIYIVTLLTSLLFSESLLSELQKNGLEIKDKNNKKIRIKRALSPLCTADIIKPKAIFGDAFAGRRVADICKKTFVTKIGVLQPMSIGKGIKTAGELEVLLHIKKAQENPNKYLLIDARTNEWFNKMRIPTSVNLPFNEIKYIEDVDEDDFDNLAEYEDYKKELQKLFGLLNIVKTDEGLDFKNAKSLMLYCNASWCSQSPNAIYKLINMGYPIEKIMWYRGGLQDWLIYDYTVTKGK